MLGSPVVGQGSRGWQYTGPPLTRVSPGKTFNDKDGRYIYDVALLRVIKKIKSARRFEILMVI